MRPVLLATCSAYPDGDEDGPDLLAALAGHGLDARFAAWTDAAVDWAGALVVLRSTWDYTLSREEFLSWLAALPNAHNPLEVVQWNSDKVYLRELEALSRDVPLMIEHYTQPEYDSSAAHIRKVAAEIGVAL